MPERRCQAMNAPAGTEKRFPCRPFDKKPYTNHGFHSASDDPSLLDYWAWKYLGCLWGTTPPEGAFVVDEDPRHGGDVTLGELVARYGTFPETRTTRTRGGGCHYWLSADCEIRQDAGRLLGTGLDVRVHKKGYVIVPDSPGYTWLNDGPIAPAPTWLVEKLAVPVEKPRAPVVTSQPKKGYGAAALRKECENVANIPVGLGQRNHGLYLAAVRMGTLVGAGVIDVYTAAQALLNATSLPAAEAKGTILSGLTWGAGHPRQVRS